MYPVTSPLLNIGPLLGSPCCTSQVYWMWWPCPPFWNIGFVWLCCFVSFCLPRCYSPLPPFQVYLSLFSHSILILSCYMPSVENFLHTQFQLSPPICQELKFMSSANSYTCDFGEGSASSFGKGPDSIFSFAKIQSWAPDLCIQLVLWHPLYVVWRASHKGLVQYQTPPPSGKCGLLSVTSLGD